jgi:hypothetical protein
VPRPPQPVLIEFGQLQQLLEGKGLPQHTRLLQDLLRLVGQPAQPVPHRRPDTLRHRELVDRLALPPAVLLIQISPLHQIAQHLLQKEGIAFRPLKQQIGKLFADLLLIEGRCHQSGHALLRKTAHGYALHESLSVQLVQRSL